LPVGAPLGSGATFIAAKIPAYAVVDFASDWQVTPWLKLLAGVSNLTDRRTATTSGRPASNPLTTARGMRGSS